MNRHNPEQKRRGNPEEASRSAFLPLPQPFHNLHKEGLFSEDTRQPLNWGLWVQRYARWEVKNNKYQLTQSAKKHAELLGQNKPHDLYQGILRAYEERLQKVGAQVRRYILRSRLVIGLGGADVREVGFTFHRHGFPYLPASSVKGLARAAAQLLAGASEETIHEIFGWAPDPRAGRPDAHIGKAVFWDAIPLPEPDKPLLELDVLNPHFPDYYRSAGEEPPGEWQSPVPIFFLAVPAGTAFLFAVGGEKATEAWDYLHLGLTELGTGAKTTLGYGLWEKSQAKSGTSLSIATGQTTEPSSSQAAQEIASSSPAEPPRYKGALRKGTKLPARIIGPGSKGLLVQLWTADAAYHQPVECSNVASTYKQTPFIEVEIVQIEPAIKVKFSKPLR